MTAAPSETDSDPGTVKTSNLRTIKLADVCCWEILDSRGRPTLRTEVRLENGAVAAASVPSGASTGSAEAKELRDGDPARYRGLGCRKAVANVEGPIRRALVGRIFPDQAGLDQALLDADGTDDKRVLGANAILSVSLACARVTAAAAGVSLHRQFAALVPAAPHPAEHPTHPAAHRLPRPTINLWSGGKHAGGQIAIQDVLVVPVTPRTIDECLAMTYAVYQCAVDLCRERYGMRALTADEGGLAPPFGSSDEMLASAIEAVERAGLVPGKNVALAIDVASSHFFSDGRYRIDGRSLDAAGMIDLVASWVGKYPIVSVEDALAEDEWTAWPQLRARLSGKALVVGDDFLCTRPERIKRAVEIRAADALLLKVNQIGTLTEAAEALSLARNAGWQVTVSARSGETEDDWLADLAVGWRGDQIKVGSITQSERLAKYNRLLAIERETAWPVNPWPAA